MFLVVFLFAFVLVSVMFLVSLVFRVLHRPHTLAGTSTHSNTSGKTD